MFRRPRQDGKGGRRPSEGGTPPSGDSYETDHMSPLHLFIAAVLVWISLLIWASAAPVSPY